MGFRWIGWCADTLHEVAETLSGPAAQGRQAEALLSADKAQATPEAKALVTQANSIVSSSTAAANSAPSRGC
jgi:hypothetical protein